MNTNCNYNKNVNSTDTIQIKSTIDNDCILDANHKNNKKYSDKEYVMPKHNHDSLYDTMKSYLDKLGLKQVEIENNLKHEQLNRDDFDQQEFDENPTDSNIKVLNEYLNLAFKLKNNFGDNNMQDFIKSRIDKNDSFGNGSNYKIDKKRSKSNSNSVSTMPHTNSSGYQSKSVDNTSRYNKSGLSEYTKIDEANTNSNKETFERDNLKLNLNLNLNSNYDNENEKYNALHNTNDSDQIENETHLILNNQMNNKNKNQEMNFNIAYSQEEKERLTEIHSLINPRCWWECVGVEEADLLCRNLNIDRLETDRSHLSSNNNNSKDNNTLNFNKTLKKRHKIDSKYFYIPYVNKQTEVEDTLLKNNYILKSKLKQTLNNNMSLKYSMLKNKMCDIKQMLKVNQTKMKDDIINNLSLDLVKHQVEKQIKLEEHMVEANQNHNHKNKNKVDKMAINMNMNMNMKMNGKLLTWNYNTIEGKYYVLPLLMLALIAYVCGQFLAQDYSVAIKVVFSLLVLLLFAIIVYCLIQKAYFSIKIMQNGDARDQIYFEARESNVIMNSNTSNTFNIKELSHIYIYANLNRDTYYIEFFGAKIGYMKVFRTFDSETFENLKREFLKIFLNTSYRKKLYFDNPELQVE